ncbi:MAG TPA: type II CAAX endopeptidase family protein [Geobacterales bacterium]|nr:type II CAAX endopeptidase family protein [Geobacterales bacterium]
MKLELSIVLAFILWLFAFRAEILNFWLRITLAASILFIIAITSYDKIKPSLDWKNASIGVLSGLLFYAFLYLGYNAFKGLVYNGASAIYALRTEASLSLIASLLIITSIAEESFWRGFVQREFYERFGKQKGIIMTSLIYGAIHVWSLNPPLMFIALVMGLAWGYLYYFTNSLISVICSHITWTEMVFVALPLT